MGRRTNLDEEPAPPRHVLTLNGGSSSIKFAIYLWSSTLLLKGKIDRIGTAGCVLEFQRTGGKKESHRLGKDAKAADALLSWLAEQPEFAAVDRVGHRVVHGMHHSEPERVTPKLLRELRQIVPFDPEHLPLEIELMEACKQRYPKLKQLACFDTAFHRTMPTFAKVVPIPLRYRKLGVERYGFHGISYSYLFEQLKRINPKEAFGRVVYAHLGNGASLAAVLAGKCVDTTMGFTPGSGLVMGTRTGDIDPGLAYFLSRTEGMTPAQFQHMANHESGLLGISGISSDVRDLRASKDPRAFEAIQVFGYQAAKSIAAMAAALGGIDSLVFSGGIGENDWQIRAAICRRLRFLGVRILDSRNRKNAELISVHPSTVQVRIIPTDEERMIAGTVGCFPPFNRR